MEKNRGDHSPTLSQSQDVTLSIDKTEGRMNVQEDNIYESDQKVFRFNEENSKEHTYESDPDICLPPMEEK